MQTAERYTFMVDGESCWVARNAVNINGVSSEVEISILLAWEQKLKYFLRPVWYAFLVEGESFKM